MNEIKEERFILSYKELLILLAAKGIEEIYIPRRAGSNPDEKETCYLLNNMFQNSLLHSTGEKFSIVKPLDHMFMKLKEAEKILLLHKKEEFYCIYMHEESCVVLQMATYNEKQIAVFVKTNDELMQLLCEYSEEQWNYTPILEEDEGYQEILFVNRNVNKDKLMKFQNIPYLIEVLEPESTNVSKRLLVRVVEEEIRLVVKSGENIEEVTWSKDEMEKQLELLVGEEEI